MNLVMTLLYTRRAMPKARIREVVEAYRLAPSDEAFDRMFERDKEELRELGVPLVTEDLTAAWEDEPGYRIHQRDYALPQIDFAPDELAVLGLAARAWSHATLAGPAAAAVRKLHASGVESDGEAFIGIEPRLATSEPAFGPLLDAITTRNPVAFDYRRPAADAPVATRHVHPWGLTNWRGRWYLTGHDTDRLAPRVFRLSRISGAVRTEGTAGSYDIPANHDGPAMIRTSAREPVSAFALLLVREGAGHELRAQCTHAVGSAPTGWSRLQLPYADPAVAANALAAYGASVRVLDPPELVEAIREGLAAVLAAHPNGEDQ